MSESTALDKRDEKASSLLNELVGTANTFEERAAAFQMASVVRRSQMVRKTAQALKGSVWSKANMSAVAQASMCEWAFSRGIDPTRHIDILGDSVYLNAEYYGDKLKEWPEFSHLTKKMAAPLDNREFENVDEATRKQLMKEQQALNAERYQLQMEWCVPPEVNKHPASAAATVLTIHTKDGREFTACRWRGKYGKKADPVGEAAPVHCADTSALRAAATQCVEVESTADDGSLEYVQQMIKDDRTLAKTQQKALPPMADYPRPPAEEKEPTKVRITKDGEVIDESDEEIRQEDMNLE